MRRSCIQDDILTSASGAKKLKKVLLFNPRSIPRRLVIGFRGDL